MMNAVRTVLYGISQIFFLRSAPAGALLLIGIAVANPRTAVLVVIGCAVQTLAAWIIGERELVRDGLMGYNGALVGAAASLSTIHLNETALSIAMTVVGALACIPAHLVLRGLFDTDALRRFGLPVSTAPFCLVAGLLFGVLQPIVEPGITTTSAGAVQGSLLGMLNPFAEVVLADGLVPGLVILAALLVGSLRVGLWGLFGSLLALVLGLVLTGDIVPVSTGLIGYSAVLVAIALGAIFCPGRGLVHRLVCAAIGVAAAVGLRWVLDPTPIPTYTWPFLLAMWAVLIADELLSPQRRQFSDASPSSERAPA